jgi:hypothetical protein
MPASFLFHRLSVSALLLLLLCCVSCAEKRTQQGCRMAAEYVVAKSLAAPSALHLQRLNPQTVLLLWSADRATRCVKLDNAGIAISAVVDIVPGQTGRSSAEAKAFLPVAITGLQARAISSAQLDNGDIVVGILTRGGGQEPAAVHVALIDGVSLQLKILRRLGEAGLFSTGLSLTRSGQSVIIAWQDTRGEHSRIPLATLHAQTLQVQQTQVIERPDGVFGPALATAGNRTLAVWTERNRDGDDEMPHRLMAAFLTPELLPDAPVRISGVRLHDATPALIPLADAFGLAFRDDLDNDDELEFYFTTLPAAGGTAASSPQRISRADGPAGPRIGSASGLVYSAQVRSYQRNLLVGFNRFDQEGTKLGGEFQVYADKSDFLLADVDVREDGALLVYAEASDRGGRILSAAVHCR